jgi:hypothetical protein
VFEYRFNNRENEHLLRHTLTRLVTAESLSYAKLTGRGLWLRRTALGLRPISTKGAADLLDLGRGHGQGNELKLAVSKYTSLNTDCPNNKIVRCRPNERL